MQGYDVAAGSAGNNPLMCIPKPLLAFGPETRTPSLISSAST